MLKTKLSLSTLFLTCLFSSFGFSDVYVDSYGRNYTYSKSVPYRYVSLVTQHEGFINIYLDNGMVWKATGSYSTAEALSWCINDPVIIYPCNELFHTEDFYLVNDATGNKAYVNISCSPSLSDPTYLNIREVCYTDNVVTVENGQGELFYFQVAIEDLFTAQLWAQKDCLVLGWNKDWLQGSEYLFPYVLINTNTNEYVKSEYIQY